MAKKKTIDEAPKDEFIHTRDTNKSMDIIKQELKEQALQEQEEIKEEETEKKEEDVKTEEAEIKPQEKVEEKKEEPKITPIDKEEFEKTASELRKEIDEIKGQNLSKKEEKEAIEEAKTRWTKEGRNPKDYDEIVIEAEERAFKKAQKYFDEQLSKREEDAKKAQEEQQNKTKQEEEEHAQMIETVQKNIDNELKELRSGGFLPEIKDPQDPSDEGKILQDNLFREAVEFNNDRIKNNLPPENSIAKFYFMHFSKKNTNQPAGADAPVSASRPAAVSKETTKPYVYSRDHNKSFRQIMEEERQKYR